MRKRVRRKNEGEGRGALGVSLLSKKEAMKSEI